MTEMLSIPTGQGKLQVFSEGILQVVAPLARAPVYSIACRDVTGIATYQGKFPGTVDLTITTASSMRTFTMITSANAAKLQALFPHLQAETPELRMFRDKSAWWLLSDRSHVSTYTNMKVMQREIEQASQHGWTVVGQTGTDSHVNVGRSVTKFLLTGGIGMMTGASRSKETITVTFARR